MMDWYGFIIGLALVVGIWVLEYQAHRHHYLINQLQGFIWSGLVGGLLGARLYYVVLHWSYYQLHLDEVWQIWQGGSSMIGVLLGGFAGMWWWSKSHQAVSLTQVLDLVSLVLPISQAIGRWGNWINQELYGLPTTLPWGIFIQPEYRLTGFENHTHFHPLFLYEALLLLFLATILWQLDRRQQLPLLGLKLGLKFGHGYYFLFYIFYYSFIRFWLDFIRIDKVQFFETIFGMTQILLVFVMAITIVLWFKHQYEANE